LFEEKPNDFQGCIEKARRSFQEYFSNNIKQLMHVYPLDKKDKDGKPFWSLPKRPPSAAVFDPELELHQDLVAAYACLYATMFKIAIPYDKPRSREAKAAMALSAKDVALPEFKIDEAQAKEIQQMVEKEKEESKEEDKPKEELAAF